jgi:hypothetical protein
VLSVSESLLLLALHDEKGTVGWSTASGLAYGLAGGLLLDLALQGRVAVDGERVSAVALAPSGDELLDEALARVLASGRPRDAKHWVNDFSGIRRLRDRLLQRLVDAGVLRREAHRVLWLFPDDRYPTVRPAPEAEERQRLLAVLLEGATSDERSAAVIGLARACGLLDEIVPPEGRAAARARAAAIAEGQAVAKGVRGAIDDATAAVMAAVFAATITTSAASVSSSSRS